MEELFTAYSRTRNCNSSIPLRQGIRWGLIGGLASTLVMDLVLMGLFAVVGIKPLTCFSIVGDTVARLFSLNGIAMAGGIPLGIAAHYLIGPVIGVIFGAAAVKVDALRTTR